uniref:Uncharacterized protein n=1 Tax=Setaria viridis TaxID=4556 RepID=A0A4U6W9R4_SETVI|nr:hypothetical protein SEVIR_1G179650v2 [Setaria viridis]
MQQYLCIWFYFIVYIPMVAYLQLKFLHLQPLVSVCFQILLSCFGFEVVPNYANDCA